VDRLDRQFDLLAIQPLMSRAREEVAQGVRGFPFGRYVIFYMPFADEIDVIPVLHATSMPPSAMSHSWPEAPVMPCKRPIAWSAN
jgi:plasmid stabilization system protein ParE